MRRFSALLAVFSGLFLFANITVAAPGCPAQADLEYLGANPAEGFSEECRQLDSFTIRSGAGEINIEVYGFSRTTARKLEQTKQALTRAGAALADFAGYSSVPVKVYMSPRLHSGVSGPEGDDQGVTTLSLADASGGQDCVIALFRQANGPEYAQVVAHEFFHCVELTRFDNKMRSGPSAWWSESIAEWFAGYAYPGTGFSDGFVQEFDVKSIDTPLTGMTYPNIVFLWWLEQDQGADAIFALMEAMPDDRDESADEELQKNALEAFLGAGAFLRFTENYLDGNLVQTGGRPVPSTPRIEDIYNITEASEMTLAAPRFVPYRATLLFDCGEWDLRQTLRSGVYGAARDANGAWGQLPDTVSSDGSGQFEYLFAGGATAAEGLSLELKAGKDFCAPCATPDYSSGPEACLVGDWTLVSGGLGEVQSGLINNLEGAQNADIPDMQGHLVLNRDGTFTVGPSTRGHIETNNSSGTTSTDFVLRFTRSGTWSVNRNRLERCYDITGEGEIAYTTVSPSGERSRGRSDMLPRGLPEFTETKRYTCEGNRLEIEYMRVLFRKINMIYEK